MKKIIFLEVLITAVIIVLVILTGIGLYALSLEPVDSNAKVMIVVSTVAQVIFLAGLVLARMALSSFITRGFFNNRSVIYLRCSGWLFMIFGILCGIGDMIFKTLSKKDQILQIMVYLTVLMIGLGLTIIADLVAKGEDIERENKLII